MVVESLDSKNDIFRPHKDNEELFGLGVPDLSAINALLYLTNNMKLAIDFCINL